MRFPRSFSSGAALLFALTLCTHTVAQSSWVTTNADGHLVYAKTPQGDRIPDFSSAGYEGGGIPLPQIATTIRLSPSGKDDTAALQEAIDDTEKLPLKDGFRGAVELAAGTFHCAGPIIISSSGVVLRGAGTGNNGTRIELTGAPHLGIRVEGKLQEKTVGEPAILTDTYIPSGETTVHVANASGFHAGDTVRIAKPITPEWVHFMGMDTLRRSGREEHWVEGTLFVRRRIASVNGNAVTFAIALMDNYDTKYLGRNTVTMTKVDVSGQIDHVGIEQLRIIAPARSIALEEPHFDGLTLKNTVDAWIRSVSLEDTTNSVFIESGTERITVLQVDVLQRKPITSPAKPFQFSINGSQILLDRCSGSGDKTFYVATQARQQGPVVVLNCRFKGDGHIEPHQRWSTGLLIDNCIVQGEGGIDLINRGIMGTGHGWTIGWSVVWNSTASELTLQRPPGTLNWSMGNRGTQKTAPMPAERTQEQKPEMPQAIIESQGRPVQPKSLYLQQLSERKGAAALKSIGYEGMKL